MNTTQQSDDEVMEEETYQKIISAIQHPVRRRILRMLLRNPQRFTDFVDDLKITGANLAYHLARLSELIAVDDNVYHLSTFGIAAINLIEQIEDPQKAPLLARIDHQQYALKREILDDYKRKYWWHRFVIKSGIFFLCSLSSFIITQYLNLPLIAVNNLRIETILQVLYLIPFVTIYGIITRVPQMKTITKDDLHKIFYVNAIALISLIFTLATDYLNWISRFQLATELVWPVIGTVLYLYFIVGYPLLWTVAIDALFRNTTDQMFQTDISSRLSERFGIPPHEVQQIITANPV